MGRHDFVGGGRHEKVLGMVSQKLTAHAFR